VPAIALFLLSACNSDSGNPETPSLTTQEGTAERQETNTETKEEETTAETEAPEPVKSEAEILLEDIISEYKKDSSSGRYPEWGIIDGVFYGARSLSYLTYDINSGNKNIIEPTRDWKGHASHSAILMVINGNFYGFDMDTSSRGFIRAYDLQGNLIKTSSDIYGFSPVYVVFEDGSMITSRLFISSDLQTVSEIPQVSVDVGHGITETKDLTLFFAYDKSNVYYVRTDDQNDFYLFDLTTMEHSKFEGDVSTLKNVLNYPHPLGKYLFESWPVNKSKEILNFETGETLDNPLYFDVDGYFYSFEGESFYYENEGKLYKVPNLENEASKELVFDGNRDSKYYVIDTEYFIVTDSIGQFLYKFGEDLPIVRIDE